MGMRVYNKSAFALGLSCGGVLLLFTSGIIAVDWWQWVLTFAVSGRYLYIGLSKTANDNANAIQQHYNATAIKLFGKYALIKTNLPIIFLAVFFSAGLFIRFVFDIITPVSIAVVFCIVLTISVAYSIGLDQAIRNTIKSEMNNL